MPRISFSYWRHNLRSVSVNLLFMCFFFHPSLFLLSSGAAFMFPRQPSPTSYHNTYQLYTMENTRQTILNDYITSQQMQVIPRPDMARGLSPREQPVAIPYPAGARGTALHQLALSHLPQQAGERSKAGGVVCRLCACEVVATFSRRPEANDLDKFCWFAFYFWGCNWFGYYSMFQLGMVIQISICWVVASYKLTTIPLSLQPCCLLINLYLGALTDEGDGLQLSLYGVHTFRNWWIGSCCSPLALCFCL